ncbi:hypothetical protein B0T16DRAFT_127478 [Cercophora newfieldiana]|uniref:Zn(2)-C6 fungal-type domain-containing protein n=1 Tax=Cercophora newfieldiana TaxID=92897 RepID=A0AA39YCA8_9PEZI|nr:hypothetical protein B0T16DRAFT_127478 [Cercophora newfieldiana]
MKRRLSPSSDAHAGPARRARQPQISCDFCRSRKLRCGPERPCPHCLARDQPCEGGSASRAAPTDANLTEILQRLRRLEQAVFSVNKDAGALSDCAHPESRRSPGIEGSDTRHRRDGSPSADLAYPEASDVSLPNDRCPFAFQVAKPAAAGLSSFLSQWTPEAESSRLIFLPAKEDALALFDHFLQASHFMPSIVHASTARSAISDVCSPTAATSYHRGSTRLARAAFTLSICATAAFFWEKDSPSICRLFPSEEDICRPGHVWRRTAWDMLDQLRQLSLPPSLEEVQANAILGDLIYNIEGCSPRLRFLHSRSVAIAREMSLHLLDAKPAPPGTTPKQDEYRKEVQRRLWWYISSSNWLLSVMGGPHDRTYTVNPHHTIVNFPANVNNDDPFTVHPPATETDMTYFNLRIRLAEVCRKVTDALPLGSGEINELPFDRIAAISRLFDEAYSSMPPTFALGAPISSNTSRATNTARRVIHLSFHARRARIFRPFLLSAPNHQTDPRFSQFRAMCLHSARVVLDVASELVREGLDGGKGRTQWSGCVISHLFIACVVLVTHPGFATSRNGDESTPDPEAEAIGAELSNARQLLERAAKVSLVAGNLVRKLVDVLKRSVTASSSLSESATTIVNDSVQNAGYSPPWLSSGGPAIATPNGAWDHGNHSQSHPHLSESQWADLAGTAFPDGDGWGQLFADLDAAFPAPFFT